MRLLIIEDDRESADYLVKAFREVGHVAELASDGEEGLALAESGDYDVLVVDRMLPKRDGLSVIGTLREKGNSTPVLILSALGQVDDRIKGLRAGGDDYLPKPYAFAELLARVEVLSRRRGGPAEETAYRVGDLELDRLVLLEVAVTRPLDRGEVDEHVRAAALLGDEAVALLAVEPLDSASCHTSVYLGITPALRGTGGGIRVLAGTGRARSESATIIEPTAYCDRSSR